MLGQSFAFTTFSTNKTLIYATILPEKLLVKFAVTFRY